MEEDPDGSIMDENTQFSEVYQRKTFQNGKIQDLQRI